MRVGVVQFASGEDKPANLARLATLVREAADAGATLVVCPEAAMHEFGPPDRSLVPVAEPLDGPFVTGLVELAGRCGATVVAGMFESIDRDRDRVFNTVVAVDGGGLIGNYRKLHLFDALGWRESSRLVPGALDGSALLVLDCADLRVGVMTCYDIRFPEIGRALVDAGATALAVPSAWVAGPGKEQQWLTLARARAIENTCWVFGAGQSVPEYAGHSVVVDPVGVPVAGVASREGVATAAVSAARVAEVRAALPVLEHRRFAVTAADQSSGSGGASGSSVGPTSSASPAQGNAGGPVAAPAGQTRT